LRQILRLARSLSITIPASALYRKCDPEIVFPRTALANLASRGLIGSISPLHFSFMGGLRQHEQVEKELAPALGHELAEAKVDLALLVPY